MASEKTINKDTLSLGAELEGISVLVLDDDHAIAELIRIMLDAMHAKVTVAANGYQGLQSLLFYDIDVAIVDVRMPLMDGFEFISEAKRMCPWLGCLILSGYVDDDVRARAEKLGVMVMTKPFNSQLLVESVKKEALQKRAQLACPADLSIDRRQREQKILQVITMSALQSASLKDSLRDLSNAMSEIIPVSVTGLLELKNKSMLSLEIQEPVTDSFVSEIQSHIEQRYSMLNHGRHVPEDITVVTGGLEVDPSGVAHVGTCHTIPMIVGKELHGLLSFATTSESAYSSNDISFLYHAANHISSVITDIQKTHHQALHDSLTGLYNRYYLFEQLTHLQRLAQRYSFSVGVVIIDLDKLKIINDTYGHLAGDDVIREIGDIISTTARASDIVARYGGDEFVIILPKTQADDVEQFCSRVIDKVSNHVFCAGSMDLRVMVSIGASYMKADGDVLTPREFLSNADQALYQAKLTGVGGLQIWSDGDEQATHRKGSLNENRESDRATAVATEAVINTLTRVLEARQHIDGLHWSRTRKIALAIGHKMNLSRKDLQHLGNGALLHDIGKLAVPDHIIKKEAPLSEEEWRVIRRHPEEGFRILQPLPFLRHTAEIVRHHQERYDGSGYPAGLKGSAICRGARIVAVADAYDAMSSTRPYRKTLSLDETLEEIRNNSGTQFDPDVVDAFLGISSELANC